MEIVEKDFKLTPVSEDSYFFDLELLQVIKPRGKESREEFKISGYGLTLDTAIKKIAMNRVCKNHKDEAINLKQFYTEFKEEIKDLIKSCQI